MPQLTKETLKGDYAIIDIGRGGQGPQAGVSVARYDGEGGFSGITIQDLPGRLFRERVFVKADFAGTYNMHSDGTGSGVITTTLPDGSRDEVNSILVITKTITVNETEIADEFTIIREQLGLAAGNLFTLVATRLPDGGNFTNASLQGDFAYTLIGEGGPLPQSGLGLMTYDGTGTFTGTATVNLPGTSFGERRFVTAPFVRPYTVNPDGTATPPGESDIVFVITRADLVGDIKVAKEVFFIVRELNATTGNLLTGVIKKYSR